jgi:hypothetical protein
MVECVPSEVQLLRLSGFRDRIRSIRCLGHEGSSLVMGVGTRDSYNMAFCWRELVLFALQPLTCEDTATKAPSW